MKTFLTRILPLLLCIAAGNALSWCSMYAFWFAIAWFHSLPVARALDAVGMVILLPGQSFYEVMGGDQTTRFNDPTSFMGTNGLIVGILLYCVFRAVWTRREGVKAVEQEQQPARRVVAKVG